MAWFGGQYTVTGSAVNLTTALSLGSKVHAQSIRIDALTGNTGSVHGGPSDVTVSVKRRFSLPAGTSWSSGDFSNHPINTDEVYLIGPGTSEVVMVSIVS